MAIIARLFRVIIAYVLACIAASIVLTVSTLAPEWDRFVPQDVPAAAIWAVIGVAAAIVGGAAMLPALVLIALTDRPLWRARRGVGAGAHLRFRFRRFCSWTREHAGTPARGACGIRYRRRVGVLGLRRPQGGLVEVAMSAAQPSGRIR
jgi:hypothetical protein